MSFGNILFIFVFLPLTLLVYWLTPAKYNKYKNILLVIDSLLFYSWSNPTYLVLLMFSIVFNYISALEIDYFRTKQNEVYAKYMMYIAVIVDLLTLGFFKYFGFVISNINAILHTKIAAPELALPIGISFYTFTVLSYIFDVYSKKTKAQKDFMNYTLYVSFFPKLVSGPIVQYNDFEPQINNHPITRTKLTSGVNMFIIGLAKKVIIADNLGYAFAKISAYSSMTFALAWLGVIMYALQLYFDFSGYSDMAIGIAKMFGFNFDANFNYPYLADSISDFWRRWHISLGAWFRNYLYFPLGGSRVDTIKIIRNLMIVWLATGLWHGASWTFIIWGLWHGLFQLLEKFVLKDIWPKVPRVIRIILTDFIVVLGWVWFFSPNMSYALNYFQLLCGAGGFGLDKATIYYLSTNIRLVIIAIIAAFPLVKNLHANLVYRTKNPVMVYGSVLVHVALFVLCVAYLIASTYSTFLYFQF